MRLESWIEQLVEEPFVRLFAGRLLPQDVARHLVRALEDGERIGADGTPEIPGRYQITLNPEDLHALKQHHPNLNTQLAAALESLAQRMHIRLQNPPSVTLQASADLQIRNVRITPANRAPAAKKVATLDIDTDHVQTTLQQQNGNNARAYLIIQGERTFDLNTTVVRVGRALDNDLVIENPRISRHHAQLRQRHGRYILKDLGSRSGTMVNGIPVQEIVLRPGDLISLSGVDLIYAEEEPGRRTRSGNTQTFQSR